MNPWPFTDLTLVHDDLTLRPCSDNDMLRLAQLAEQPVLPAGQEGWLSWTWDRPLTPEARARQFLQYLWTRQGELTPEKWAVSFCVHLNNVGPIGVMTMLADRFALCRVVRTGSWLGGEFQRRGFGTRMRSMVIDMGFRYMGADYFVSDYVKDNLASAGVSAKLGYENNGMRLDVRAGQGTVIQGVILGRERWVSIRPKWLNQMTVTALEPCLTLLGAEASSRPEGES